VGQPRYPSFHQVFSVMISLLLVAIGTTGCFYYPDDEKYGFSGRFLLQRTEAAFLLWWANYASDYGCFSIVYVQKCFGVPYNELILVAHYSAAFHTYSPCACPFLKARRFGFEGHTQRRHSTPFKCYLLVIGIK